MQIRVVNARPWEVPADVLVVPVLGESALAGAAAELDKRSGGHLGALLGFGELSAKRYATVLAGGVATGGDSGSRAGHLLAVQAGDGAALDRETVVHLAGAAMRRLSGRSVATLAVWLDPLVDGGAASGAALAGGGDLSAALAELVGRGIVEGSYEPHRIYRDDAKAPPALDELVLVASAGDAGVLAKAAERGRIVGEGANLARTLSNRSANDVSPEVLAEEAYALARKHGLWIDVIGPDKATEMGMGLFMAVGRGSDNPPRMIVMRNGKEGAKDGLDRHLALVGKGVCFDSGGISIKPSDRMDEMKMDKTGACTVIAAMVTAKRLSPETPLLVVAPAVENMPGPHSTRPGDVVKALNGKWVDIGNTDAEGRLILADGMTYAERLGATHVVDVATLTGAVGRALGELVSGLFGTSQDWIDAVQGAASRAGERYWQLPLVDEYHDDMDSWYGDLVNFARNNEGGLVKSALFLREFVTKPWVHLDIAGTGYYRKATPYAPRGATGVSHATLVELALAGART
ncbi:MAG TPA: leucyl aminopeptidase [Candidatus Acidoferrales bacterium]|nr:leucyl aminopeptidase [Candidatus Acidoferrales bacterium]